MKRKDEPGKARQMEKGREGEVKEKKERSRQME